MQPKPTRSLVVSIHDVSPYTYETARQILAELNALGVGKTTLLVIPNHHRKGSFLDDPEFCAWLLERDARGDEIVLHGCLHWRDPRPGETLREKRVDREGEFHNMPGAEALRIVSQAKQEFRKLGLVPLGFVPPAWLLSDGADRALQRLGFAYTTHMESVFDYTTGIRHASQTLVWASESWGSRFVSRLWNARLFRQLRKNDLLRISIHPLDWEYPSIRRQIRRLVTKALKTRDAVTYGDYLQKRELPSPAISAT